jgi:hypothetical protein
MVTGTAACRSPQQPSSEEAKQTIASIDEQVILAPPNSKLMSEKFFPGETSYDIHNKPTKLSAYLKRTYQLSSTLSSKEFWTWVQNTYPPNEWSLVVPTVDELRLAAAGDGPLEEVQFARRNYRGFAGHILVVKPLPTDTTTPGHVDLVELAYYIE